MTPLSIKSIQAALKIPESGIYDDFTEAAVRNYQLRNSLTPSGIVDNETASVLLPEVTTPEETIVPEITPTTDLSEIDPFTIKQYRLKRGQFLTGPTKKEWIFLHHTAGWENPYRVVDDWAQDSRGPVGTHFVIGGRHCQTLTDKYDGDVLQCFDYENYGWHNGLGSSPLQINSIGIELCNFGFVTKSSTGDYLSYVGKRVAESEIVDLGSNWRGYRYFHRYTERQLKSLDALIRKIGEDQGIDVRFGLQQRLKKMNKFDAFNYDASILSKKPKGLFVHANVAGPNKYGNFEKWDLFPQDELIDLIMSL